MAQDMEANLQQSLALLWRRVLRTNRARLFGAESKRLRNLNWGDRIAQPGFVGPNYEAGGLVFVSMNPGGGDDGLGPFDKAQYKILKRLRKCSKSDAATHFSEFNALLQYLIPRGDIGGPIFQNFLEPVLHHARTDFSSVAYLNLLKWRTTKESRSLDNLYDLSWRDHTGEQFRLLKPRVVIAVGVDAGKAFQRHHTNHTYHHAIHRVYNNIGKEGRDDIRMIRTWLKKHPLRRS